MGDHFVLLVDRLLTESTLEAAIESRNRVTPATVDDDVKVEYKVDFSDMACPGKLVECRICHDEGFDSSMETPCSCCGSLKYAHRRCVQRWCNEKGDTMCEICHQPFKPGYTAPPPLFQIGRIPMNFRGNWEITTRNLNSPHFITMVSRDRNSLNPSDYSASITRRLICCRAVAIIFMVFLILRHTLPLIISENKDYSFPLFMMLFLRIAGIVLPVYVMMRVITAVQRHRHLRGLSLSSYSSSDEEEAEDPMLQQVPH